MRSPTSQIFVGLGVALALVALTLLGVSMRLDRVRTERMMISREAIAIVDEAIAAAPPGTIEVRVRNSVVKRDGRTNWLQGEFVLDATASAAAGLRARVGHLSDSVGLRIVTDSEREEEGRPAHLWSLRSNGQPLVQVLVRLRAVPDVVAAAPPVAADPAPAASGGAATAPRHATAQAPRVFARPVIRPCPPQVAIIIDDVGYVFSVAKAFLAFDRALTLAVFPHLEHSTEIARRARAQGREIMMHLPMESTASRVNPGTLRADMTDAELQAQWEAALRTVPGIVGLNNHQGSIMTADREAMERVLHHVRDAQLFFIDSRTTKDTVARATAVRLGVPTNENDLFLDNVKDVAYIKQKCQDLLALALVKGDAIGVAHAHPTTLQALQEILPEFDAAGVQLVYVSALVN